MPTYITLWNYTQRGIEHIDDSPNRLDSAIDLVESLGGEMKGFYLTMGEYDIVSVIEFPDDDAAAKAMLRIGQTGAVEGETLKAWPEAEYRDLIANLP
ncbi:GYD domain-containing protein [Haloferax sp. MBLA0076]|uniref:GYD domain-containing protein n=1 Tax=Haloferax litoreum TaxID=2666140 RepID=A0A6A8GD12_9EURY|nr:MULTISPECIES: GYD domain-containing protein [Haloferax]KAB1192697.1 GYD domain-containing protein [Haloferax sp. CBA1148]MRX21174.1 GYD domain-containing protein [Haloferax litoreum]